MTKILHAVKGGLLSYCDKVYSRGNINQKHCIGGVMVCMLASSAASSLAKGYDSGPPSLHPWRI